MWVKGLCWIDCVWSSNECTYCACDPSVHLSAGVCSPYVVWLCDFAYYVVG